MPSRIAVLIIALAVMAYTCDTARGQDMKLLEYPCQDHSHEPNSDAEEASDEVYDFLLDHAADLGYNTEKRLTIGYDTYYGEVACNGRISQDACIKCVGTAYEFAIKACTSSSGDQVKFRSRRFRVDNYAFDSNW